MSSSQANVWRLCQHEVKRQLQRMFQCRECDGPVTLFENTCPHCGASEAVRIPWAASAVLLSLPVLLAILYFACR